MFLVFCLEKGGNPKPDGRSSQWPADGAFLRRYGETLSHSISSGYVAFTVKIKKGVISTARK